jgi:hypothetical protein
MLKNALEMLTHSFLLSNIVTWFSRAAAFFFFFFSHDNNTVTSYNNQQ